MAKLFNFIICCFLMCGISGLLAKPILDNDIMPQTSKCQSCPENRPECEPDQVLVEVMHGTGEPGSCCSHYKCVSEMPVCDRAIAPIRYYPNACIECTTCSICQSICPLIESESEQLLNCLTYNDELKMKGDIWMENDGCTRCECDQQSERSCKSIQCLEPDCENPVQKEGVCCPVCPSEEEEEEEVVVPSMGGTTSGPHLWLNVSTTETIEDPTMDMIDPSTPMPDEANDSSTTTTATSSVPSTENEPRVVPLGSSTTSNSPSSTTTYSPSSTTTYSPSSSTENDSSTASEGPELPPNFDGYSSLDSTSTKPSIDLIESSTTPDGDGPTDIFESSSDASSTETTYRHEYSIQYSIEFNKETTAGQMTAEISTEEITSTEDALPKASDNPSTSDTPAELPLSTSSENRPPRTVYNGDDVVSVRKDGIGRYIWPVSVVIFVFVLLIFATIYCVKKQRNGKEVNPAYHVVSQNNPQTIVTTGQPLLPPIGGEAIKEVKN
ncbi:mucin-5AC [Drosophila madeirensis]|uniref:Mucin-5AC n=1 Tax=Drosophila madeirensis TaxID=30013 RepID=A0AAU9FPC3_DROMD